MARSIYWTFVRCGTRRLFGLNVDICLQRRQPIFISILQNKTSTIGLMICIYYNLYYKYENKYVTIINCISCILCNHATFNSKCKPISWRVIAVITKLLIAVNYCIILQWITAILQYVMQILKYSGSAVRVPSGVSTGIRL